MNIMKRSLIILLLSFSLSAIAQTGSCGELMNVIKTKGMYSSTVSSYTLDSNWLNKVTLYGHDMKYYVIAEIKENRYSYNSKSYIFCGIPFQNWISFKNGRSGDSDSYEERFHKYVFDYQCSCN